MEKIVAELLVQEEKPVKDFVFEHSDNMSLYLSLRHAYLSPRYQDQSTKVGKHLSADMFSTDEDLKKLTNIIGKSVYIYPRLHTSLPLIIAEIYISKEYTTAKLRLQLVKKLTKALFENYFFNESVYQGIKSSVTRPKFLHIGLKFW